jgi:phosphotransferase system IIB component
MFYIRLMNYVGFFILSEHKLKGEICVNYEFTKVARKIFYTVGAKENILSIGSCITRLRLILKDKKNVDISTFKSLKGILGVVETSEQLQIIMEPRKAKKIINEFIKISGVN